MNKKELLLKIHEYAERYNQITSAERWDTVAELEIIFQNYLKEYPNDCDIWLKLIRIEFHPQHCSFDIFQEYFKKALAIEERPIIYVLKAYAEYVTRYIYPETYELLCKVKPTTDEDKAMIAYVKGLAVEELVGPQQKEYELYLLESIQYGPNFFWNYVKLGRYYLYRDQEERGRKLIQQGIDNVIHIYGDNEFYDPTDVYEFLNERIKGIHLTDSNFNHASKDLTLNRIKTQDTIFPL